MTVMYQTNECCMGLLLIVKWDVPYTLSEPVSTVWHVRTYVGTYWLVDTTATVSDRLTVHES